MKIKALIVVSILTALSLSAAFAQQISKSGAAAGEDAFSPAPALDPVVLGSEELNSLIEPMGYPCPMPDLPIEKSPGCGAYESYPRCKWQVPPEHMAGGKYKVWWRTPPWELWGSKRLVQTILSSIAFYKNEYPQDEIYVGDLDAPDSRHFSHQGGVDVDIYLLRWMEWIQVKDAKYVGNMSWRKPDSRVMARDKVMFLARSFAICSAGKVRIFYNDPGITGPFNNWFASSGYVSPFGLPMQSHNDTHHDHFHITVEK